MMDISVDSVCQFIIEHGGKVKNTILVSHFKKILNDPETKDAARQKFKECVNAVAVVKTENGEKHVQLKKKYRNASNSTVDSSMADQSPGGKNESTKMDDSMESQRASMVLNDTLSSVDASDGKSSKHSEQKPVEDTQSSSPKRHSKHDRSPKHKRSSSKSKDQEPVQEDTNKHRKSKEIPPVTEPEKPQFIEEETHFKYEGNRKSSRDDKMDVVSTDRVSAAKASLQQAPVATEGAGFAVPSSAPLRKKKKENIPPAPTANGEQRISTSVDRVKSSLLNMSAENRMSRGRPSSLVPGSYSGSVERARQNFQGKPKTNEDAASLALSEKSLDSKGEEIDDDYDRNIPSVALDLNEKSWIIRSAQGNLVEMRILLDSDSSLVEKKDFVMNALHWAAKKGNIEMMEMLLDQKIDINTKTGYTALHLAAMSGHKDMISKLLDNGADMHVRDYSGHKPIHYFKTLSGSLNGKRIPYDETVPLWKRNYFAGTNFAAKIPRDLYDRLDGKNVDRKLSQISLESGEAKDYVKGGPRLSNPGLTDRKNSFEGTKAKKLARKETKIKAVKRKPTFLRTKSDPAEPVPPQLQPPPAAIPQPIPYKPAPPLTGMWKPLGPKS